jgi:hypothetical protein
MYFLVGLAVVIVALVLIVGGAAKVGFRAAESEPDETARRLKAANAKRIAWLGAALAAAIIEWLVWSSLF